MLVVSADAGIHSLPGRTLHPPIDGATRVRLRRVLQQALRDNDVRGAWADLIPKLSLRLEACALAFARGQSDGYLASVSRMTYNLRHNGSAILHSYPVSRVCKLSHKRMHAETAHTVRDAALESQVRQLLADAKQAAEDHTRHASEKKSSHAIRCPKCKTQTGIVRMARQTRAADEGMTTTCLCVSCSWSWSLKS